MTDMTITILDTTMTSDQNPHTARHTPERNGREMSWLPGQVLDRDTAMLLAGTAGERDLHAGHRLWPHTLGWAAELAPAAPGAITRASGRSEKISDQEPATSRADPDAEP
jgi:hypothetical protein